MPSKSWSGRGTSKPITRITEGLWSSQMAYGCLRLQEQKDDCEPSTSTLLYIRVICCTFPWFPRASFMTVFKVKTRQARVRHSVSTQDALCLIEIELKWALFSQTPRKAPDHIHRQLPATDCCVSLSVQCSTVPTEWTHKETPHHIHRVLIATYCVYL